MPTQVSELIAREVIDSRGNPTLEVEARLSDGSKGRAIVPSGASKGAHEALELRDGDKSRFGGKGVERAVALVEERILPRIKGKEFTSIQALDSALLTLDGTPQKEVLGANTVLGVSLAFSHALAASRRWPLFRLFQEEMGIADAKLKLPIPMMNIINGGAHANNGLSIQEFMIVPHGFDSFREALRAGCEIFQNLKTQLHEAHFSTGVGDEGGFAPDFEKNEEALEWIVRAIEKSGYKLGSQVSLALDVAASSFFSEKEQKYELNSGKWISTDQMIDYLILLAERFPIVSIEDGLYEDDWDGWKKLTQKLAKKIQLVGDDLFVTQKARLEKGISNQVANAILIKVNQVGTLKETFETMQAARASDYRQVVSHRSGETEDVTIAHLAVGSGAGQIKTGSLSRSERIAKYNELLRIEDDAQMTGRPISFALGYQ